MDEVFGSRRMIRTLSAGWGVAEWSWKKRERLLELLMLERCLKDVGEVVDDRDCSWGR